MTQKTNSSWLISHTKRQFHKEKLNIFGFENIQSIAFSWYFIS